MSACTTSSINWIGLWTLYKKEVHRFLKVYNQTLFAPMITSLLFLAIFSLALGNHVPYIEQVPFQTFMATGLIIMSIVQNAFANTSSTLVMGKVMGTIIDYIMPPLSAGEITFALVMGGITRGLMVGVLVAAAMIFFVPLSIYHTGYLIFHVLAASALLALLGILAGILAETFDQMSAITSYVITPLSFLSGTFYSVKHLPPALYTLSHINPFFYMIDGFRYSLTGHQDGDLHIGIAMMTITIIGLWITVYILFKKGYRLKT